MRRIEVNPGDKYGNLTIVKELESIRLWGGQSNRYFLCKCDCGGFRKVILNQLRGGTVKKCRKCAEGNYYKRFVVNGKLVTAHRYYAFNVYGFKKQCSVCGSKENIVVHHIDRNIKNNSRNNLQVLCVSCYMKHHSTGNKYSLGKIKRKPKICEWCGKEFLPKKPVQRFCSNSCSSRYKWKYSKNMPRKRDNKGRFISS